MAEARLLKQREYGTDVLSHPEHNVVDYNRRNVRYTNTMKSQAFHIEPDHHANRAIEKRRSNNFAEKPCKAQVQRASYQDSNIFGYKDSGNSTVQRTVASAKKEQKNLRSSDTFQSKAFGKPVANNVRSRDQNTFKSSVFGSSIQAQSGFKKLGGDSQGTQVLFGSEKCDYSRSNHNGMIEAPKEIARPERPVQAASDAKAREVFGNSAAIYGYNKEKKADLVSQNSTWQNTQRTIKNNKNENEGSQVDTREKKYEQLQSSVFGGGYIEGKPVEFDREAKRNNCPSTANWQSETGRVKPVNAGPSKVDCYRQKQKQLASQILEQTDYTEHAPISKKGVDLNNAGHDARVKAKGRKTDAEFKSRVQAYEPMRRNYEGYDATSQKQNFLASSGVFGSTPARPSTAQVNRHRTTENRNQQQFAGGRDGTRAAKMANLACSNPIIGSENTNAGQSNEQSGRVVDLQLGNLPANTDMKGLKKMTGAKNIVNVDLDQDNMKGICKGTGRVQIRLNGQERLQDITKSFADKGISVSEYATDARRKPNVTQQPKLFAREVTNTRQHKQASLSTNQDIVFK